MGMGLSKRSTTNHHQYKQWHGEAKQSVQVRIFGWLQAFNIERHAYSAY